MESGVDDGAKGHTLRDGLILLGVLAPLAGLGAGVIGALFRQALEQANHLREALAGALGPWGAGGLVLFVVLAASAAAAAAWLVRRVEPTAAGSGIPRVMAVLDGAVAPAPARVIPVKFVAGTLAIGSGLALGREGPTVQMGASFAYQAAQWCRRSADDARTLLAAGAGAGFAVAFNAPIAGALFVFEALVRRFEPRLAVAALAACAVATWVGRALSGQAAEFTVPPLTEPALRALPWFVLLGLAAGLAGMVYHRTLLGTLHAADRLPRLPVEARAAAIGGAFGALAWFAPGLVGSGDGLAQQALNGQGTLWGLPLLFLLRLGLIALSVAAGAPGGLLVPFLALGAELGLWVGLLGALAFPGLGLDVHGFAVVGMAALFAAIVRTPLTAVVLVCEMTASATLWLPLSLACCAAMLVPTVLGQPSILDALKARMLDAHETAAGGARAAP